MGIEKVLPLVEEGIEAERLAAKAGKPGILSKIGELISKMWHGSNGWGKTAIIGIPTAITLGATGTAKPLLYPVGAGGKEIVNAFKDGAKGVGEGFTQTPDTDTNSAQAATNPDGSKKDPQKSGLENMFTDGKFFGVGSIIGAAGLGSIGMFIGEPWLTAGLASVGLIAGQTVMNVIQDAMKPDPNAKTPATDAPKTGGQSQETQKGADIDHTKETQSQLPPKAPEGKGAGQQAVPPR